MTSPVRLVARRITLDRRLLLLLAGASVALQPLFQARIVWRADGFGRTDGLVAALAAVYAPCTILLPATIRVE